jgi:ABC-type amino acid transport substrate-binding protein
VLAHRFDVGASGLRDSATLRHQVCVSNSYLAADLGLLTRVDRKVESVRGYRVGVLRGGRAVSWLREHERDVKFTEFAAEEDVLDALKNGAVDVVLDEIAFARFAQQRTGGALRVSGTISTDENYVFAMSSDNGGLKVKIDEALGAIGSNGKLKEIEKKWLGR